MGQTVPDWLGKAVIDVRPGHAGLAAAKFGSAELLGKGGFELTSAAFSNGMPLDPSFTADEEDAVAPPLEWSAPPAGAQELVLIVENPDAAEAGKGGAEGGAPFCHWLVWGLPGQKGQILEGETPPRTGKNSLGNSEWKLPDPPTGGEAHQYVFQLFALDLPLTLMSGATREELLAELDGHVMAVALLTATYRREAGGDYDWEAEAD